MRWDQLLMACLVLGACRTRVPVVVDTSLPDADTRVEAADPLSVLELGTRSEDPTSRARAIGWLIKLDTQPAGGHWGPQGLYDPDSWVQRNAANALLVRLAESETVDLLSAFAQTQMSTADPYVRGMVALRLADAGHVDGLQDLSQLWRAESRTWRAAPLQLAAAVLGDGEALVPLQRALSRGDLPLEPMFLHDVGQSGLVDLVPALKEGGAWAEDELVLPYAVARMELGDRSAESILRQALGSSNEELQLEALDYLVQLEHPEAQGLLKRARGAAPERVQSYASVALAARGVGQPEVLLDASKHTDREVRAFAARFAADLASSSEERRAVRVAQRVLRSALEDPDAQVRATAFRGVARLRLPNVEPALRAGLREEYLDNRVDAAGAWLILNPARPIGG